MSDIRTKPSNDTYRRRWEEIFGKKDPDKVQLADWEKGIPIQRKLTATEILEGLDDA